MGLSLITIDLFPYLLLISVSKPAPLVIDASALMSQHNLAISSEANIGINCQNQDASFDDILPLIWNIH